MSAPSEPPAHQRTRGGSDVFRSNRRGFLRRAAAGGVVVAAAPLLKVSGIGTASAEAAPASFVNWITGASSQLPANPWGLTGTDLGIPYAIENGEVGYLFGDTFTSQPAAGGGPGAGVNWRSPVMLRSDTHPTSAGGIRFKSAAGQSGNALAPQLISYPHNGNLDGYTLVTAIPNDAVHFPETGRHVMSFMSIRDWTAQNGWGWRTNYAGLAVSDNGGNSFQTVPAARWFNDGGNQDPSQMWSMQRMGDWVYIISVRAGRQSGPMMLRRVRWDEILDPAKYQSWGHVGGTWQWGSTATPILSGRFGEPSLRLLADGTWVMAYLEADDELIVTRTAAEPTGPWSSPVTQIDTSGGTGYYGSFIHPWSLNCVDGLHLIVSGWFGYHSGHWTGTL